MSSDQAFPQVERAGVTTAKVGKRKGKKAGTKMTNSPSKNLATSSSGAMFGASHTNNMASQPVIQTHINFNVSNNNMSYNNQDI